MTWLGAIAVGFVLFAAAPALAGVGTDDGDADGVSDDLDDCPDTPPGDMVNDQGCSLCPCDSTLDGAPWSSRKAYLACTAGALRQHGASLSRRERKGILKRAKQSSCGDANLTRCCIYPDDDQAPTRCKLTSIDRCAALGDKLDVDDAGSGSCTPSPCD